MKIKIAVTRWPPPPAHCCGGGGGGIHEDAAIVSASHPFQGGDCVELVEFATQSGSLF